MNEEPIEMKVKAVRQIVERAGYWKCTVTLTTPGRPHKDPTVDVDSNDVEKIPRLGDVLLVFPPRIVGYASERVAQCPSAATDCSQPFADCDCDEQIPSDDYVCEKCGNDVTICAECYTIIAGCECGHCPDCATFHEND